MATETQNGKAFIHGVRNSGTAITVSGFASLTVESAKSSHKFKLDALEDETGFDTALIATNEHIELDLQFMPSAATRAAAEGLAVFLPPLAKVTLANFAIGTFNGDYVYIGDQSIELGHKQGKIGLKVRRYIDTVQNALLTTTVSG